MNGPRRGWRETIDGAVKGSFSEKAPKCSDGLRQRPFRETLAADRQASTSFSPCATVSEETNLPSIPEDGSVPRAVLNYYQMATNIQPC